MRLLIAAFCVVLLVLAVVGLVLGFYIFGHIAALQPQAGDVAILVAIRTAAPVLTLGAISLGLLTTVLIVDRSRADQVALQQEASALAAEKMRRDSPARDPALASRRARIAAEQEARVEAARQEQ